MRSRTSGSDTADTAFTHSISGFVLGVLPVLETVPALNTAKTASTHSTKFAQITLLCNLFSASVLRLLPAPFRTLILRVLPVYSQLLGRIMVVLAVLEGSVLRILPALPVFWPLVLSILQVRECSQS